MRLYVFLHQSLALLAFDMTFQTTFAHVLDEDRTTTQLTITFTRIAAVLQLDLVRLIAQPPVIELTFPSIALWHFQSQQNRKWFLHSLCHGSLSLSSEN